MLENKKKVDHITFHAKNASFKTLSGKKCTGCSVGFRFHASHKLFCTFFADGLPRSKIRFLLLLLVFTHQRKCVLLACNLYILRTEFSINTILFLIFKLCWESTSRRDVVVTDIYCCQPISVVLSCSSYYHITAEWKVMNIFYFFMRSVSFQA